MSERFPWFPCEPSKLLTAMAGLSSDQQLVYVVCLLRIYEVSGPISDDSQTLSNRTHLPKRRVEAALEVLFSTANKLYRTEDGKLMNKVAESTLKTMGERREYAVRTGKIGADERWRKVRSDKAVRAERLTEARKKGRHTSEEWAALVRYCGNKCVKCGSKEIAKDHIIQISDGGSDAIENLQPLCFPCNSGKMSGQDFRPSGWESVIDSIKEKKGAYAETGRRRSDSESHIQDSLFTDVNRAPEPSAPPVKSEVMKDPPLDPEADYYRRGREVLGGSAGGVLTQLIRAKGGNLALARAAIEQASTRGDPRQYIGAMIRNFKGGTDEANRNGAPAGRGGFSTIAARVRRDIAERETFDQPAGFEPSDRR